MLMGSDTSGGGPQGWATRMWPSCQRALSEKVAPHRRGRPGEREKPRRAGLSGVRRRGLEPPPGYPGPGPQPGASTNSAIGARALASIAPGWPRLSPSRGRATVSNTCSLHLIDTPIRRPEEALAMDLGKDLTKRQQEIFDFIKKYSAKYGYPPTVRDIGKAVGLASSSTVHAHLANLEKAGLLRRDPSKPRALELLDKAVGAVKDVVTPSGIPLVGQVAA